MRLLESQYELLALIASRGGWMPVAEIPKRLQNALDICRGKPLLVRVARCGTFSAPPIAYLTTQGRAELARHAECGKQRLPAKEARGKSEDIPAEVRELDSIHVAGFEIHRPSQPAEPLLENPDNIEEPPGVGGQADNKADKKPKKSHPVPVNPDILKLAKKIKKDQDKGMSQIDSAREFCEGNERRAQSLLRQLRRYPRLWK